MEQISSRLRGWIVGMAAVSIVAVFVGVGVRQAMATELDATADDGSLNALAIGGREAVGDDNAAAGERGAGWSAAISDPNGDSDQDGFPNRLELAVGTDPYSAESRPMLADRHERILGYWPLAVDASDESGQGHDGALKNGAVFINGALNLDGKDDYVSFGHASGLSATNGVSWCAWIKPGRLDGLDRFFGKTDAGIQAWEYGFLIGQWGRLWGYLSDSGTLCNGHVEAGLTLNTVLRRGEWRHVGMAWGPDGAGISGYGNGRSECVWGVLDGDLERMYAGTGELTLGSFGIVRWSKRGRMFEYVPDPFQGQVGQLVLYTGRMSGVEARELWLLGRTGDLVAYVNMDFDSDGMPDWWERKYFGNIAADPAGDADQDGLNELAEYLYGTNPLDPDSDHDGFTDGQEVAAGSNPMDSGSVPQTRTLEVASAHGQPTPGTGTHTFILNSQVECRLAGSPETFGATQFVCLGWTGSGSVPASGQENSFFFPIAHDSMVAWTWVTNYFLNVDSAAGGVVNTGDGWRRAGSAVTMTAFASEGYRFAGWSGDVLPGQANANPLTLAMDQARIVSAAFERLQYAIVATAGSGGAIAPSGASMVEHGGGLDFVVSPAPGNRIEDVLVDGVSVGAVTNYSFVQVTGGHVIEARFAVIQGGLPPDPATVAPPASTGVVSMVSAMVEFLYAGPNPIQTGVSNGAIRMVQAAVMRGVVLGAAGLPVSGVEVSVVGHPKLGSTQSRIDGAYDLVVNGGCPLVLEYRKVGYLPVHRQADVPWQDYVSMPEVVLTVLDAAATIVQFGGNPEIQVAGGSVMADDDGVRQARILFPTGTTAWVVEGGVTQAIESLTVRMTEYTVGGNGPTAMPAELPTGVGYTYCVELSADEAGEGQQIVFSEPVYFYLDNFLSIPVGIQVPVAYYDYGKAAWVPTHDGRVIRLMGTNETGLVMVDMDGDGLFDSDSALSSYGFSESERRKLAETYPQATNSLWRVPVRHFSPHDCNFGVMAEVGAQAPQVHLANEAAAVSNPAKQPGYGEIDLENQSFLETIAIAGTSFSLNYNSARMPGTLSKLKWRIPLTSDSVPPVLKRIELMISVSGKVIRRQFSPAPELSFDYEWDGLDAYGRKVSGSQILTIEIGYVYNGYYTRPEPVEASFGLSSGQLIPGGAMARRDVVLRQTIQRRIGADSALFEPMGGWSLSAHHVYDPVEKIIYLGTGEMLLNDELKRLVMDTAAGTGGYGYDGDGGPATQATFRYPNDVTVGPGGEYYVADANNHCIRRIGSDGIITTFAGTGVGGFSGDNGLATEARLSYPKSVKVAPDGSVYIADTSNRRIRRVGLDGIIRTVAGNGSNVTAVLPANGLPALEAPLRDPYDMAVSSDGAIYITDRSLHCIRRVGPDGIMRPFAGDGDGENCGDSGPASNASFLYPSGLDVGSDGSVYVADTYNQCVRRIAPDGIISTVAGDSSINRNRGYSGDGGPATSAELAYPEDVVVSPQGDLYVSHVWFSAVRHVSPQGIITTVAGTGEYGDSGDNGPARGAQLYGPRGIALAPDGSLYIAEDNQRIRHVKSALPGVSVNQFDLSGRHLRTLDSLTGRTLLEFGYDRGLLVSLMDADGNETVVERDATGKAKALAGPFGHRTSLAYDTNGWLAAIGDPEGRTNRFEYTADGLLNKITGPRGTEYTVSYDSEGRVVRADDPSGGFTALGRSVFSNGGESVVTSAFGRVTRHWYEVTPLGETIRTFTGADGLAVQSRLSANGQEVISLPDGTEIRIVHAPDVRFGMQSPVLKSSSIILPSGLTSTMEYGQWAVLENPDNPLSVVELGANVTRNGKTFTQTYLYDGATRWLFGQTPEWRQTVSELDDRSRPVRDEVPNLANAYAGYDGKGRVSFLAQGEGDDARAISFGYGNFGSLDRVTNALAQVLGMYSDRIGRVTNQVLPDGSAIAMRYDKSSNLAGLTPSGKPEHGMSYTAVNLLEEYAPAGQPENGMRFTYNAERQVTSMIRPDGMAISNEYDFAGRLSAVFHPGERIGFSYDPATGKLTGMASDLGLALAFGYDGPLPISETWTGPVAGSVEGAYNEDFQLASVLVNGALVAGFGYDQDGLLNQAGDMWLSRDAQNGFMTGITLGNITESIQYTPFGERSSNVVQAVGTDLYSVQYAYDKLGRITNQVEWIAGGTRTMAYAYDLQGRLAQTITDVDSGVTTNQYEYDSNGNRTNTITADSSVAAEYDTHDRLLTFGSRTYQYNVTGTLTNKIAGAGATAYEYDPLGGLRSVTLPDGKRIEYVIDPAGRRIGRKVDGVLGQGFLYQGVLAPIAELDGAGAVKSLFVYGTKANVPEYMVRNGNTYRIVTDHLGSPRLVLDAVSGEVVQRMDYDEWGNVLQDTNPGFQPFGFAGGLYDSDTGLVRFGARDYDPETGRWTARDPILFAGGQANLYVYCSDDPINSIDPLGLDVVYLVDTHAVGGAGHAAAAVGNDRMGWTYYSFGASGDRGEAMRLGTLDNYTVRHYHTFEELRKDNSRYDKDIYYKSSKKADMAARREGNSHFNDSYWLIGHNCDDVASSILRSAGVDFPDRLRPNATYKKNKGNDEGCCK